ncbi:prepilin-type N-terminal cleavage/methylation domain-containing protein [bacterium]|nr:prepilin-type N-terminal cleavage/methylation domain-containing protein [bacterium]
MKRKNLAFSMAEVMVTLVVIGVIALMTVPNLVDSSNQRIYQAASNKADYVVAQEALRLQTECPRFRCFNDSVNNAAARLQALLNGVKANEKITYTASVRNNTGDKIYVLALIDGDDVPILYTVTNTGQGLRTNSTNEIAEAKELETATDSTKKMKNCSAMDNASGVVKIEGKDGEGNETTNNTFK